MNEIRHYHLDNFKKHWLNHLWHTYLQRILNCPWSSFNSIHDTMIINIALVQGLDFTSLNKTFVDFEVRIFASKMLDHGVDVFELLVPVPAFLLYYPQKWIMLLHYLVDINLLQFLKHEL